MSDDLDLRRVARHEAGHAVGAHLLGRVVLAVSLNFPPVGGGAFADRLPREPLGHQRRPTALWHETEDELVVLFLGELSENLEDYDAVPVISGRVEDDPPPAPSEVRERLPQWVTYQDAEDPPQWPHVPLQDADQIERLSASFTSSEEERVALVTAMRLRAEATTAMPHYRHLHTALVRALEREGHLHASDVKHVLARAEVASPDNRSRRPAMARQLRSPFPDVETVEAITGGVCEDLDAEHGPAGGYWLVKEGSIWQSSARIVQLQPAWFVPLGAGQVTPKFWPERELSS